MHLYKTLVYPVMCDKSTCHSAPLMCWGNAGNYYSGSFQTFMQRRSYQLSLSSSRLLDNALRGSSAQFSCCSWICTSWIRKFVRIQERAKLSSNTQRLPCVKIDRPGAAELADYASCRLSERYDVSNHDSSL